MIWEKLKKLAPILLILSGLGLIAVAFAADYFLGGSKAGFGYKQFFLLIFGICFFAIGAFLALPFGSRFLTKLLIFSTKDTYPGSLPLISVWFGVFIGLLEVVILANKTLFNIGIPLKSPHFIWMIPVGDILIFLIPGLLFFVLARLKMKFALLNITLFTLIFLGSSSLMFMFQKIHYLAALVLSVGLAIQISRLIMKHHDGFYRLVRVTLPGFFLITVLFFIIAHGWQIINERRALAQLPPAPADSPNVLLIVLDTVRAKSLSLYGYNRATTPTLQHLAESSVVFERAISPSSWTLPSHASIFTGRWLHELSVGFGAPLNDEFPTLAGVLAENGYVTSGFVANTLYCGWDFGLNRGFIHYEDYTQSIDQIFLYTSLVRTTVNKLRPILGENRYYWPKTAKEVNSDFLHWLPNQKRPFFAFLNYMDAHDPYLPPDNFEEKFGSPELRADPYVTPIDQWSQEEVQAYIDAYDGSIAYLDTQIGLLIDELEKEGVLENTLVIIVSDHGEQFNDNNLFGHANSLYLQALHVPLLIMFPNHFQSGERVNTPVSLRDIPATILDILNIDNSKQFPGTSFADILQNGDSGSQANSANTSSNPILSELNFEPGLDFNQWDPIMAGDMKSLLIGDLHYILNGSGAEELYDIKQDPQELKNLVSSKQYTEMLNQFRKSVAEITVGR